jgi:hypothetical protein
MECKTHYDWMADDTHVHPKPLLVEGITHPSMEAWHAGCRCDECVAVKRRHDVRLADPKREHKLNVKRAYRRKRILPAGVDHGTADSYYEHNCRCWKCTLWHKEFTG